MASKVDVRVGFVGLLLIASFVGCNQYEFPMAKASGRVRLDGQPLTNAKVMFAPVAAEGATVAGKAAFGRLDVDGRFTLGTFVEGDGAVVGEHWVTVVNLDESKGAFDRITVPGNRFSVTASGPNEFSIELTIPMMRQFASGR